MILYNFPRSSASIRVRAALGLKGVSYESRSVELLAGAHREAAYAALNPQRLVPFLVDGEVRIGQSMAILEYLEERHPQPALWPASAADRARARAIAQYVVSEIQPVNGLRVGHRLAAMGVDEAGIRAWRTHWVEEGFAAVDQLLVPGGVGIAEICVYAQAWYARVNLGLDLGRWPNVARTCARLDEVEAVRAALP